MSKKNIQKKKIKTEHTLNIQKVVITFLLIFLGLGTYLFIQIGGEVEVGRLLRKPTPTLAPKICETVSSIAKALPSVAKVSTHEGYGSGFLVGDGRFIVSNGHVVGDNVVVQISLPEEKSIWGKVVWRNADVDLALIVLPRDFPLQALSWGDSNRAKIGEVVVAVGFPLWEVIGGEASVTRGSLSAKRFWEFGEVELLQTDTPINPGNSGGPLLNECGEVIGINQTKCPPQLGCEGIGFAISANKARPLIEEAINNYSQTDENIESVSAEIAESLVRDYYSLINSRRFYQAYSLLSSKFKASHRYELWLIGVESLKSVSLGRVDFRPGLIPVVLAEGGEVRSLGGKSISENFTSEWALVKEGSIWKLDQEQLKF